LSRHIKKYYFYLLGIFHEHLKKYDAATEAYSKVLRYRFFFANTSERFEKSYAKRSKAKNNKKSSLMICGGVGDFLQHLPYVLNNKSNSYIIITHFPKAKKFFEQIGVKVEQIYIFSDREEEKAIVAKISNEMNIYRCPRKLFMEQSPFLTEAKLFTDYHQVIGIHAGGSSYSVTKEIKSGNVPKTLPKSYVTNLLKEIKRLNVNVIFFGMKNEIESFNIFENDKLKFSCHEDITQNLSVVSQCNAFIGSDSAFKTMSSMLKIPTIVLCSAPKNNFRDRMFIDPYIKHHVMYAFKYNDFSDKEIREAVTFTKNTLVKMLN
jgi:ADP-heptose:LPS heptosyltransferase